MPLSALGGRWITVFELDDFNLINDIVRAVSCVEIWPILRVFYSRCLPVMFEDLQTPLSKYEGNNRNSLGK